MRYVIRSDDPAELTLCENDDRKSILQNIAVLLSTRCGTVPMYREFGLPMNFLDKPMSVAETLMAAEIKDALADFEPRATYIDLSLEANVEKPGEVIVILEVEI